tara:strand:- start:294 stop:539 length:246 start_codon:yes stop_codon:yes gene_type:complete
MKFEEIEKLLNERKETELKLREQVDKKVKILMSAGYGEQQAYRMLVGKVVDFRTLMRWHTGETMRPHTIDKLNSLIEEEEK